MVFFLSLEGSMATPQNQRHDPLLDSKSTGWECLLYDDQMSFPMEPVLEITILSTCIMRCSHLMKSFGHVSAEQLDC